MSSPRSGTRVPFLVLLLVAAVALVSGCGGGDAEPEITDAVESHAPEDVPYSPSARFNQLIPDGAETDPRSDAVISRFVENANVHRVNIATTGEVPPIYRVSSDDPFLSVWVDGEKIRFRVPDQASPGGGEDHPLVLLDRNHPDFGRFVELRLFQAWIDRDAGEIYAEGESLSHYNHTDARLNPDGSRSVGVPFRGGGTGSGLSILAGLVRPSEVASGRIQHAVRFAYSAYDSTDRFRAPATKTDQPKGGYTRDPDVAMDMGMRLQLDPDVDCDARTVPGKSDRSRETRFLRVLCRAMQEYGMIMLDGTTNDGILIEMEDDQTADWTSVAGDTREGSYGYIVRSQGSPDDGLDRNDTSGIPWDRLRVIAEAP
ncbi:MAG: hypothetical protein H6531_04930 [Actinobacteria bacterium]|nr:hypothetical protein [Thermoleophilia bacterium]MCB9011160.1 hypothetical protein [Actinomycetota bacterium]